MAHDVIRLMQALFPAARPEPEACWQPAADVYRGGGLWMVKLDLAGVRPQDVSLTLEGSRLTVRGTRRDCTIHEGCCHYRMEIAYSRFERSIDLPCDLRHGRLTTEYQDGMLLIRIETEETPK